MWLHGYLLFTVQIKALSKQSVLTYSTNIQLLCLLCLNDAVICACFDLFDIAFNSLDLFDMKQKLKA